MSDDRVRALFHGDADAITLMENDDLHAAILMRAAKAVGIPAEIALMEAGDAAPMQRFLRLELPRHTAYFRWGRLLVGRPGAPRSQCQHINGRLFHVIRHKQASKELIKLLGFPVPEGQIFERDAEDAAVEWSRSFGRPVCVKPALGSMGTHVFPELTEEADIRHAFRSPSAQCKHVLVEESAPGSAVRFFFVRPRIVGLRIDLPANVDGDGQSTIAALIDRKNTEKRLRTGHAPTIVDDDLSTHLRRQGLRLEHIPASGQRIFLRSVSNGYKGGDSFTTWSGVHPSYVEQIAALCNAAHNLVITAVDTKIVDPMTPATPTNYRILEINNNPGLVPFHFPWKGESQDVAGAMIRMLLAHAA